MLLTLQVAVWVLCWSVMNEPYPVPAGFPAEVFERRGVETLSWVPLVGHDADTYGAVAGPLLVAAHGDPADEVVELLDIARKLDAD